MVVRLAILHGLVTGVGIIVSPIGRWRWIPLGGELVQQVWKHLGISYEGSGQFCGDHLVRFGIPRPNGVYAMSDADSRPAGVPSIPPRRRLSSR